MRRSSRPGDGAGWRDAPAPLGQAACDGSGRFRLDMPRISSSTHYMVGAVGPRAGLRRRLGRPRPRRRSARRRHHAPARAGDPGAAVRRQGPARAGRPRLGRGHGPCPTRTGSRCPDGIEGPHFWAGADAQGLPAWPRPAITDADGRFTIRGVGRDLRVLLMADDPRFARQRIVVDTDGTAGPKPVTVAMEPAKVITGRITYADTGKPVPHAVVEIYAYRDRRAARATPATSRPTPRGPSAPIPSRPTATWSRSIAPEGQPYLNASTGDPSRGPRGRSSIASTWPCAGAW